MKHTTIFLLFIVFNCLSIGAAFAQNAEEPLEINPENIEIVRDTFGIAHIYAPTDAEAVYGMAWAQCEDNFQIMQEFLATARNLSGFVSGKEGAAADFVAQMFQVDKFVEENYEKDVSPEFAKILTAYTQGINRYAELYPFDVLIEEMFPITPKDIIKLHVLNFIFMNHSVLDIGKVLTDKMDLYKTMGKYQGAGSNAMAYSPNKTEDGKTYLVGNPHQPTEGPVSFWELSLHSEEGLDIHGVTFVCGGVLPVIAANQHLAWTHTTNYDDYSDVYELDMHYTKKNFYKFDGEWLELEKHKAELILNFIGIPIKVKKKYYVSKYGPTYKNKRGYYAFRNNAFMDAGSPEQWYKMGKSTNFDEFWEAISEQKIPCQTITYADKDGNILHVNSGSLPVRNEDYQWRGILPGDTSATLWSYDVKYPIDRIPFIKNPQSGYVFDCNNTPFNATAENENLKPEDYPASMGMMESETHRSKRFQSLIKEQGKLSFEDIKALRDDSGYSLDDLNFRNAQNLQDFMNFDVEKYPDLADVKEHLKKWNGEMSVDNKQAVFFALFSMFIEKELYKRFALYENVLEESLYIDAARFAKKFLLKHYKSLEVELGEVQKVVRGDLALPMYGGSQTLANCHVKEYGKDKVQLYHGDTFIMYAQFGENGLESMKTINLYGNSQNPDSPHYDDQLEMYTKKQLKERSITKESIYAAAEKVYSPR